MTPPPTDSYVAPLDQLVATWRGGAGGATRGAKPASGWLLEPKGYTFLAACRANESAYEFPFDGRTSNGALTYWLLDTLNSAGANFSWRMVADRIVAKVHGQFGEQTPMLQGNGDRRVFGSDQTQPYYAVGVMEVDAANHRVRINAGEAHGLQQGTQFAVYPLGVQDFSREDQRSALLEINQLGEVDSWATIVQQFGATPIEPGAQAVLLSTTNVRLRHGVVVDSASIPAAALRAQIEDAIQNEGKGFVAPARAGLPVDFQVAINDREEFELWDPAGTLLPGLRPALRVADPAALSTLVQRLVHLAKYRNVQSLDMPDPKMRQKLAVELVGASASTPAAAGIDELPAFRPGDTIKLSVKNTQTPNPADANDPALILNITVLDLQSDWGITQIYPGGAGALNPWTQAKRLTWNFKPSCPTATPRLSMCSRYLRPRPRPISVGWNYRPWTNRNPVRGPCAR